jgi:hypothetical protein
MADVLFFVTLPDDVGFLLRACTSGKWNRLHAKVLTMQPTS